MAKSKRKPNQVAELRRKNAELKNDLAIVRRAFLDFARMTGQLVRPGHGLGSLYSPELTKSLRQHIDTVGDEAAWRDFTNSRAYRDVTWKVLALHFQDAWCESLADEIRGDLAAMGAA